MFRRIAYSPGRPSEAGMFDALYEHVGILRSALAGLVPAIPPPVEL